MLSVSPLKSEMMHITLLICESFNVKPVKIMPNCVMFLGSNPTNTQFANDLNQALIRQIKSDHQIRPRYIHHNAI